nr:sel1-like protein [Tanacetum cinerariifolium]
MHFDDDALERRTVELARCADAMLMLWNDDFSLRKIKPHKHLQCLRIELLIEHTLIHDARNKGVQRNQQAFYYLKKAAYQLQPGALCLMGAIYLTDECVKKDIAPTLRDAPFKKRCFPLDEDMKNTNRVGNCPNTPGHSEPKELPVFESYIVEAEEGSAVQTRSFTLEQTYYMGHPTVTQGDAHHLQTTLFMRRDIFVGIAFASVVVVVLLVLSFVAVSDSDLKKRKTSSGFPTAATSCFCKRISWAQRGHQEEEVAPPPAVDAEPKEEAAELDPREKQR